MMLKLLNILSMIFLIVTISFVMLLQIQIRKATKHSRTVLAGEIQSQTHPNNLIIPSIKVNAKIESVGVVDNGDMDVPIETSNVGWFNLGPRPGEIGTSVIAGHFNNKDGEPAVFANLDKLKKGDKLYISYNEGPPAIFIVRDMRTYDLEHAKEVFSSTTGIHLNLITCDGVWNNLKKSYTKRLVVFTDIVN